MELWIWKYMESNYKQKEIIGQIMIENMFFEFLDYNQVK